MTDSIIWQPKEDYLSSRVAKFSQQHDVDPQDWRKLLNRSTDDIEWFWRAFLEFSDMQWSKPFTHLMDKDKGLPWVDWFIDGTTNIASNCLDWHMQEASNQASRLPGSLSLNRPRAGGDHIAIIWENESGESQKVSYAELQLQSGKVATFLKNAGIGAGDAVGIYMPMVPEVLSILFGCFKLGVIAVPVFSGFGAEALAKRMQDAQAKAIFTADGGKRRGKLLEIKNDVDKMRDTVPSLKHVVVLKYVNNKINWLAGDISFSQAIDQLLPTPTNFNLSASHPCLYLYTSGTTGKPKGTVHTHGGTLAQIAKELGFVFDVHKSHRFFWLTDIGWMMGPWEMIGVTYWGGTLMLYDGAPDYPSADRIWRFTAEHQVTTLGISPTAIRILKPESENLISHHDLSSLKYLGSTGEAWDYENYLWFFNKIGGSRCPIMNISGGTELIGCLLTPLPTMPLPACSLGSKGLAMDVDVYDEAGNALVDSIGHLVLKQPAPSLTRGFLNDRERYLETYFNRFENTWYHGDWAKKTRDDYWFLYGRSDDTIKISGKRIGPGEIESVLIEHPAVREAAVIGVPHETKGEVPVCFIVLNKNYSGSLVLEQEIVKHVATKCGATARPQNIYFITALPKTRSGKIVRGAIKKLYLGEPVIDTSSIENQDSLTAITKSMIK